MAKQSAEEIRQKITDMMVKAITEDTPPWRKPWSVSENAGLPCNFQSGRKYTGINPLILMFMSMGYGYSTRFWGSSSAWLKQVGAHVKRDEHATHITLFRMLPKRDAKGAVQKNSKGEDILFPMLREFPVFNAEQLQAPAITTLLDGKCRAGAGSIVKALLGVEDRKARTAISTKEELLLIADRFVPANQQPKKTASREKIAEAIQHAINDRLAQYLCVQKDLNQEPDFGPAEEFIKATGATIKFGGQRAACNLVSWEIIVPHKRKFVSIGDFYETVFHELVHRQLAINGWNGEYAMGELIAEIGACFILIELNIPFAHQMMDKSKAYVKSWLEKMNSDPKYIFDAASLASKCVDQMLRQIETPLEKTDEETQEIPDEVCRFSSC